MKRRQSTDSIAFFVAARQAIVILLFFCFLFFYVGATRMTLVGYSPTGDQVMEAIYTCIATH
jgi:hypothetical protein